MSDRKGTAAAPRGLFARGLDVPAERRARIVIERGLACLSALLAVATLVGAATLLWRDWIEIVFRVDPDRGSGALEWSIVGACVAMSVAFAAIARREATKSLAP